MGQKTAGRRWGVIIAGALAMVGVAAIAYLQLASDPSGAASQSANVERAGASGDGAAGNSTENITSADDPLSDSTARDVPQFDVVRVDPDGTTVIAGTAPPGAHVTIMVDETAQQSVDADASGQFVALLDLPHSDAARALTLGTRLDGQSVVSREQIILAPSPAIETHANPTTTDENAQPDAARVDSGKVAVLRADAGGVEMVQPLTPSAAGIPDNIALDAITYDDDGRVSLGGRAKAASNVRIYLDNTLLTELETDGDGRWQAALEDIAPGLYTLRLDEISGNGDVISRMETPFQRESPAALKPADHDSVTVPVRAVTVQQGDTLWAISRDRFGEGTLYLRVFEANREAIRDPDLIYPGQVFAIPD